MIKNPKYAKDLYEELITGGQDVTAIEHEGIRYLPDVFIPDNLVICSYKFIAYVMKMSDASVVKFGD